MMNQQKIFDKVVDHLLTQKERSADVYGDKDCLYRAYKEDGKVLKCAVGCLIPDDKYNTGMEGDLITFYDYFAEDETMNPDPEVFTNDNFSLLEHLQQIHDTFEVHEWPYRLQLLATKFNLEYRGVIE
jgi:hypothetical protein